MVTLDTNLVTALTEGPDIEPAAVEQGMWHGTYVLLALAR